MSARFTLTRDTGICYLPHSFPLEYGSELIGAQLAFELLEPKHRTDAPLVVVLGGISAGRHVKEWWPEFVGADRAIDTNRYRVLGVDYLGGSGESTGPRNRCGEGPFPVIASADQANALACLLDHLEVARVHRLVGASFGGMVGLAFAAQHAGEHGAHSTFRLDGRIDGLITIGAAHEPHPMASAWRSLQRQIVAFGERSGDPKTAVALARALAMTTYRSPQEFDARFASAPTRVNGRARFPVEDYLDARGRDFAERFSAEEFCTLSQAIDLHCVDPSRVQVPCLLLGITSDQLVPFTQIAQLAELLGKWARLVEVASLYGHDGFLKESAVLTPILRRAIDGEVL